MMEPEVVSVLVDDKRKIVYQFLAYRPLTKAEMKLEAGKFLGRKKGKKLEPNTTYRIKTAYGADE